MDPRILRYYNQELAHIREMGGEFAREFPKIAGRLGLEGFECADPYVERLLEGFAFMAARVRLKVDAEFPQFTQHLLEMLYPQYLAPTPSMAVLQFHPDFAETDLAEGVVIPRDTVLRSQLGKGEQTACEYRSGHEVTMWPIKIESAEYFSSAGAVGTLGLPSVPGVKAAIRLRLELVGDLNFESIPLDRLRVYLRGADELPMKIYEQLLGNKLGMVVRPKRKPAPWQEVLGKDCIRAVGFDDDQALLPCDRRTFTGYRLLQEYFAFPNRFMFVEFSGLEKPVRRCMDKTVEIIVLLDRSEPALDRVLDQSHFALFCSAAINLFPRRADRIHIDDRVTEYHVLPDRTRPMDYEVYAVTAATGYGSGGEKLREFRPFYSSRDRWGPDSEPAYFTIQRRPRLLSSKQRRRGARSSYIGTEAFVTLVDAQNAPFQRDLRQLALHTLCTNRDLPLHLSIGQGRTDFTLESGLPIESVRALDGPSRPQPSAAGGATAWRLINHLSLNYLSLFDNDARHGAQALRELLSLYGETAEAHVAKQVEGLRSVSAAQIVRRVPTDGPITFGRGMEVTLTCEESAFAGSGVYLLGAVLEEFFSRYVSLNSFTETVLRTVERGEIRRWPARIGRRHTL